MRNPDNQPAVRAVLPAATIEEVDEGRYGPTARPNRISCIMTKTGGGSAAAAYTAATYAPAMAATGTQRVLRRAEPAKSQISKPNTRAHPAKERLEQAVVAETSQQGAERPSPTPSSGTVQPDEPPPAVPSVDREAEMGDDEGSQPGRQPAKGPRELVQPKEVKLPPPIRALASGERFLVEEILHQPVMISVGQLCDMSAPIRRQFASALQSSAPRYRRKKVPEATQPAVEAVWQPALTVQHPDLPPAVMTKAPKDDDKASLVFITAWVRNVVVEDTLVDGGSMVDLISSHVIEKLPKTAIYRDQALDVILANDKRTKLDEYPGAASGR